MVDVPVDTDRAAVHHASRTGAGGRLHDRADGGGIHGAVLLVAKTCLPVDGRDVIDDLHAGRGARDRDGVAQIASHRLDSGLAERRRRGPRERLHRIASRDQRARQVASGEPGGAGD